LEIADDDGLGSRQGVPRIVGARQVAGVQHNLMALLDEKLSRHQPQAGR
jgi:hypothetical protein